MHQPTRVPALLLLLAICGCQSDARRALVVAPEPSTTATSAPAINPPLASSSSGLSIRGYFPVSEGNTWHYVARVRTSTTIDGIESAPVTVTEQYDVVVSYVFETPGSTVFLMGRPDVVTFGTRIYRQNARGLYYYDIPYAVEFPQGPGRMAWPPIGMYYPANGPRSGETVMFQYPLTAGSHWATDYRTSVVEGEETLAMPFGRVRTTRVRTGTQDNYTRTWVSTCGIMRTVYHIVSPLRDAQGAINGFSTYDRTEEATALRLTDCGLCAVCR